MRLRILSDLHLEHAAWQYIPCGEDAVILAGDTSSVSGDKYLRELLASIEVPVIAIAGNHDFYGSDVDARWRQLRALAVKFSHLHWLENQTFDIGDYRFLGTSLWTDFCMFGQPVRDMFIAQQSIGDFEYIQYRGMRLQPSTVVEWNRNSRHFLHKELLQLGDKLPIILSHWIPSPRLIDGKYIGDRVNPYYACCMDEFFAPQIPLWIHGHSHQCTDVVLDGTRHIRNPRGYPTEVTGWNPNLVITLP